MNARLPSSHSNATQGMRLLTVAHVPVLRTTPISCREVVRSAKADEFIESDVLKTWNSKTTASRREFASLALSGEVHRCGPRSGCRSCSMSTA